MNLTNETRFIGDIAVQRYNIISTPFWVYQALEPMTTHKSISTIDRECGKCEHNGRRYDWFGKIGSRALPADIDALPVNEARFAACDAWRKGEYARAHAAIIAAFPEAAQGKDGGFGTIEIVAE